jgi:hypothetical protein
MMIHDEGLVVYYDKDIVNAIAMWFTMPRQAPAATDQPKPAKAEPRPARR